MSGTISENIADLDDEIQKALPHISLETSIFLAALRIIIKLLHMIYMEMK